MMLENLLIFHMLIVPVLKCEPAQLLPNLSKIPNINSLKQSCESYSYVRSLWQSKVHLEWHLSLVASSIQRVYPNSSQIFIRGRNLITK
ncbi:hypothetical protein O6H91_06G024700 [Diphasiastrum complanatum]|uniref:Uncharacterized protein n=1 Tax=Diphasiastrum complanatum TaxID=34168 RepID=A0ACC2DBH7_DIPCM|nr:hypothetical protein O6H91_06G024700 [Diphasiastrum complanatum]